VCNPSSIHPGRSKAREIGRFVAGRAYGIKSWLDSLALICAAAASQIEVRAGEFQQLTVHGPLKNPEFASLFLVIGSSRLFWKRPMGRLLISFNQLFDTKNSISDFFSLQFDTII